MAQFAPGQSMSMMDVQEEQPAEQHYTFDAVDMDGNKTLSMSHSPALPQPSPNPATSGSNNFNELQASQPAPSPTRQTFFNSTSSSQGTSLPSVRVVMVTPTFGAANSQIKVVINVQPNPTMPIRSFRVVFGSIDATTRVAFENRSTSIERVELLANPPRLPGPFQTGRVAMLVQAVDANETVLASAEAGAFDYVEPIPYGYPSPDMSRKRSGEPLNADRPAPGRSGAFDFTQFSPSMHNSPHFGQQAHFSPALTHSPRFGNGSTASNSPHLSMSVTGRSDSGMFPTPGCECITQRSHTCMLSACLRHSR